MEVIPETGFVRIRQIIGDERTGRPGVLPISRATWWRGVKSGKYPKPIKLGPRTAVWKAEEIRALLAATANGQPQ